VADRGRSSSQQWPLRGFWLGWFRFSFLVFGIVIAGGLVLVVFVALSTKPGRTAVLIPAGVLLAVGATIGWQLMHTAVAVTLAADGTLALRRPRGVLHTHAGRVLRVRRSVLRSSHTPTVIKTVDGSAVLLHPRPAVDELVSAIRRHNPGLAVTI